MSSIEVATADVGGFHDLSASIESERRSKDGNSSFSMSSTVAVAVDADGDAVDKMHCVRK